MAWTTDTVAALLNEKSSFVETQPVHELATLLRKQLGNEAGARASDSLYKFRAVQIVGDSFEPRLLRLYPELAGLNKAEQRLPENLVTEQVARVLADFSQDATAKEAQRKAARRLIETGI